MSDLRAAWRRMPGWVKGAVRPVVRSFVGDFLNRRFEQASLRRVPPCVCNMMSLRSFGRLNPANMFSDSEIHSRWRKARLKLRRDFIPSGIGEVAPGERRALFYIVSALRPLSVLEIGTHVGASTVHMALAMALNGEVGDSRLVSVDCADVNDGVMPPWRRYGCQYSPRDMIARIGFGHATEFLVSDSLDFMRSCAMQFDLIFLDGDHSAATVYQEIPLALELLSADGVIVLHDYYPSDQRILPHITAICGPDLAVKRLSSEGVDIDVRPVGALPWQTMPQTNASSLAFLLSGRK